jgi:hypothetical protein
VTAEKIKHASSRVITLPGNAVRVHGAVSLGRVSDPSRAKCGKRANCWLRYNRRFTEGFDTRDLKEAKALLEELHT